jgi:hypothetical protein
MNRAATCACTAGGGLPFMATLATVVGASSAFATGYMAPIVSRTTASTHGAGTVWPMALLMTTVSVLCSGSRQDPSFFLSLGG